MELYLRSSYMLSWREHGQYLYANYIREDRNGVLHNAVHRFYSGILYVLNTVRVHNTVVNLIQSRSVGKVPSQLQIFIKLVQLDKFL